ncbi:MAG TPA: hypothetical protein VJP02_18275 [Candidatus Sulfotelmatobacter sp.]|nr:hypothetical protein [Candidatus Sulfotelmatobacter sp.]
MKENSWEFVREADGTYSVFHKDERLSSGIREEYLEREVCVRYGFCGQEFREIMTVLKGSGRYRVVL